VKDICSKPPVTIRSHDLQADNIRGTVSEIASRATTPLPTLVT
jgi:hypothetical protein